MRQTKRDILKERCPCGAAFTLLSWPERSAHRNTEYLRRWLVCLDCGNRHFKIMSKFIFGPEEVTEMARLYIEEGLTLREVGKIMHCGQTTVGDYLRDAGVPLRPRSCRYNKPKRTAEEDQIDVIDWLYWGLGMSSAQVGERIGICSSSVRGRMHKHGIPIRDKSQAAKNEWKYRKRTPEYLEWVERNRQRGKQLYKEGKLPLPIPGPGARAAA